METYRRFDGRTVGELLGDPAVPTELRDALEHNLAVRAVNPTMKLSEVRELFELRVLIANGTRLDQSREVLR
jgi:hypothetical protein